MALRRFAGSLALQCAPHTHSLLPGAGATLAWRWRGLHTNDTNSGDEEPSPSDVEEFRAQHNFRRRVDGRVQLRSPEDERKWLDIKLDGYHPGSLLFRDPAEGHIYYLVSDNLKQIDLSNDSLIGRLLADGGWNELKAPLMAPVQGTSELTHVAMSAAQYRAIFTVLKEGPAEPSESS